MQRQSIYVTHQGARVQVEGGLVAVAVDGAVVERAPAETVARLLLFGNVQLTTQAMALLLRGGTQVTLLSSSGRYRGQLVGPEQGSVFLRLAQLARHGDGAFRLAWAKELLATKLRDGREQTRRFARNHPEVEDEMAAAARRIEQALAQLDGAADEETLRGLEGAAAAAYFAAFAHMVRPPFAFERRSQHPAHNPVNALLNLGYVLLANELAGQLEAAGFDPRVGLFHGLRHGRQSLALDLLEAHRVRVIDRLTLSLLNRRQLTPDDFHEPGDPPGVRLRPDALRRYLALFEAALEEPAGADPKPRARFADQVSQLRQAVFRGLPQASPES